MKSDKALYRMAWFTWASTVFLLFAGAMVTSTGSGLAVPDWPLSFGKFFPKMEGGVFYEHGHRMVAGTVAILTGILTVLIVRKHKGGWLRTLGLAAVFAVVIQASLGGITVLMKLPPQVSIAHAFLGQCFFCLVSLIVLFSKPSSKLAGSMEETEWLPTRFLSMVVMVLFFGQLLLGATVRHYKAGLVIPDFPTVFGAWWPVEPSFEVAVHFTHRLGAYTILVMAAVLAVRLYRIAQKHWAVMAMSGALVAMVVIQIFLGAGIIWMKRPVVLTSFHLVLGALCLALSVCLNVRVWQLSATPERPRAFGPLVGEPA